MGEITDSTEKPAIPASGVSAAEKYAELKALGQERPRCECHDGPMYWARAIDRPAGGRWRCAVAKRLEHRDPEKKKEYARRWRVSNREKLRENYRRWYAANPDKAREKGQKARSNPNYRRWRTLYSLEYRHRRKRERWTDKGFTLGNDDQKSGTSGDRTSA